MSDTPDNTQTEPAAPTAQTEQTQAATGAAAEALAELHDKLKHQFTIAATIVSYIPSIVGTILIAGVLFYGMLYSAGNEFKKIKFRQWVDFLVLVSFLSPVITGIARGMRRQVRNLTRPMAQGIYQHTMAINRRLRP